MINITTTKTNVNVNDAIKAIKKFVKSNNDIITIVVDNYDWHLIKMVVQQQQYIYGLDIDIKHDITHVIVTISKY